MRLPAMHEPASRSLRTLLSLAREAGSELALDAGIAVLLRAMTTLPFERVEDAASLAEATLEAAASDARHAETTELTQRLRRRRDVALASIVQSFPAAVDATSAPTIGAVLGGAIRLEVAELIACADEDALAAAHVASERLAALGRCLPAGADLDAMDTARVPFARLAEAAIARAATYDDHARTQTERAHLAARAEPPSPSGRERRQLAEAADQLAQGFERDATVEVERKYLLRALPAGCADAPVVTMAQGYLPGERIIERLRRIEREGTRRYRRTVKSGRGALRVELEDEIDASLVRAMWPLTEGRRVEKRRYTIEDAGLLWVVDEFLDRELVLAEVELPSDDLRVALPAFIADVVIRDVTDEGTYVNANLAQ